jgi:hypothetical protein
MEAHFPRINLYTEDPFTTDTSIQFNLINTEYKEMKTMNTYL